MNPQKPYNKFNSFNSDPIPADFGKTPKAIPSSVSNSPKPVKATNSTVSNSPDPWEEAFPYKPLTESQKELPLDIITFAKIAGAILFISFNLGLILSCHNGKLLPDEGNRIQYLSGFITMIELGIFCGITYLYYKKNKPELMTNGYTLMIYALFTVIPFALVNSLYVTAFNRILDIRSATTRYVKVVNHRIVTEIRTGKYSYNKPPIKHYRLFVNSWKKNLPNIEIEVNEYRYNTLKEGKQCLILRTKPGFFGMEYITNLDNFMVTPVDRFPAKTEFPLLEKDALQIMKEYQATKK